MHAVAFSVKRAHLRTVHQLQRVLRPFGLTPARTDLLLAVASGRARTQRDLWRIFHVSRVTVSRMVIALQELGLIERERVPGVPSLAVFMTQKGRRLLDEVIWRCKRPIHRLFESLWPELRTRLARAKEVAVLHNTIVAFARGFGDRSHCFHEDPDPVANGWWTEPDGPEPMCDAL